jgi:divalent metal cation (Fe/Co/Zn/Cd) transporter
VAACADVPPLTVVKLVAGIIGHSIALIADAVNSIGDGLTSGVLLHAPGVAQRPADREHPYGHNRADPPIERPISISNSP